MTATDMPNTIDPTTLPEGFIPFAGQVLSLTDERLTTVPTNSTLSFRSSSAVDPVVTDLTGMVAADIDKVIQSLPKGFHGDNSPAVPGRARNAVKAAIEDGWLVTITVEYHYVEVTFNQPLDAVMASLTEAVDNAVNNTGYRWWNYGSHMMLGRVAYGWDYDADAMRVEKLQDHRIAVSKLDSSGDVPEHRRAILDTVQTESSEPKLQWKDFLATVHDHSPSIVDADLTAKAAQAAQVQAAADAYAVERDTPARNQLRDQLVQLRSQAEARRTQLEGMPLNLSGSVDEAVKAAAKRQTKYDADGELFRIISGILDNDGKPAGSGPIQHIEDAFNRTVSMLANTVLHEATYTDLATSSVTQQNLHQHGYVVDKLLSLAVVTITVEARM